MIARPWSIYACTQIHGLILDSNVLTYFKYVLYTCIHHWHHKYEHLEIERGKMVTVSNSVYHMTHNYHYIQILVVCTCATHNVILIFYTAHVWPQVDMRSSSWSSRFSWFSKLGNPATKKVETLGVARPINLFIHSTVWYFPSLCKTLRVCNFHMVSICYKHIHCSLPCHTAEIHLHSVRLQSWR